MAGAPDDVDEAAAPKEGTEEHVPAVEPKEPSEIARNVSRLRSATIRAVAKRERLAQPLFWSLFTTELQEIKRAKERARQLRKLRLGIE